MSSQFKILVFGLPGSGKTTLAQELAKKFPCFYLNGDQVRALFEDHNFSMQGRIKQARRMRALADMVQSTVVIADFVCPTEETRKIFKPDFSIWMNTIPSSKYADTNKIFEKPKKADYIITHKNAKQNAVKILKALKQ